MKRFIFKSIGTTISFFVKNSFCLRLFNKIYENSNQKWINIFHYYVKFPESNFQWSIKLNNGKKVITNVIKDNYKTLQFAIDYKWYSPGIAIIEEAILKSLSSMGIYFDIGANLGMRSLLALSDDKKVYMFEPNDEVCDLNLERIKLNEFKNYEIIRKGVSNENGEVNFNIDSSSYKSSINTTADTEVIKFITIQTITLDSFFDLNKITSNDIYIKVDIEGHEKQMVDGSSNLIKNLHPTLLIEINEKGDNFNSLFIFFHQLNYNCFALYSDRWGQDILKKIDSINDQNTINEVTDFLFVYNPKHLNALSNFIFN